MNSTQFKNQDLQLELTAHEDSDGKLLMIRATAPERHSENPEPPLRIAVVIDRSGSMSGDKLRVAKEAASRLVESLRPDDRIAVVAYDDQVDVITPPIAPSRGLARLIARVECGGSTNLYGGWVKGAKLLEKGGRVLLLSDGLANVGRLTDAHSLADHARISLERFGVATSTIGIGEDYDESVMAGMARSGGGSHYFAQNADSIMETFKRERFLMASLSLGDLQITLDGQVVRIGQLLEGETKVIVADIQKLVPTAVLKYLDAKTEQRSRIEIPLPDAFGAFPLAEAYRIEREAMRLMDRCADLRSREDAEARAAETRQLMMRAANHELAEEEPLHSVCLLLEGALKRLQTLAIRYSEPVASFARKHSAQMSHNLQERARAFSPFREDQEFLHRSVTTSLAPTGDLVVDARGFDLRPREFWARVRAVPLEVTDGFVRVGIADPRDGMAIEALAKELGKRVRTDHRAWGPDEIDQALRKA